MWTLIGKPVFDRSLAAPGFTEEEVLRLAAALDQGGEHPLADAIVNAARARGLALGAVSAFESIAGSGVRGTLDGKALALGNTALMTLLGVPSDALHARADSLRAEGASVMLLAIDGRLAGLLSVSDQDEHRGGSEWPQGCGISGHHGHGRRTCDGQGGGSFPVFFNFRTAT